MRTDDRYYIQQLTDHVFLVRERLSMDRKSSAHDRLVRSFEIRHDADAYIDNLNGAQRKLDENNDPTYKI